MKRPPKAKMLIESQWTEVASQSGKGTIRFRAWGERAGELIEPLLAELQKLPVGRPPEISRSIFVRGEVRTSASAFTAGIPNVSRSEHIPLEQLEIPVRPRLPVKNPPEVFVSYAWRNSFSVNLVKKFCLSSNRPLRGSSVISQPMTAYGRSALREARIRKRILPLTEGVTVRVCRLLEKQLSRQSEAEESALN